MTTFLLCTETTLTRPQRLLPLIVFPCIKPNARCTRYGVLSDSRLNGQ
jgi:hypothetical protein